MDTVEHGDGALGQAPEPVEEDDLATCGKGLPMLTGTETVASVMKYCPKYQALADRVPD